MHEIGLQNCKIKPNMSIVPATNTAEKNKTRYLLRVLKAGSSGMFYQKISLNVIFDFRDPYRPLKAVKRKNLIIKSFKFFT